ncbi:MAG: hypothetical protein WDW36_008264 [Sanguina aurantia]
MPPFDSRLLRSKALPCLAGTLLLALLLHAPHSAFATAVAVPILDLDASKPSSHPSLSPPPPGHPPSQSPHACCYSLSPCPPATHCLAGKLPARRANNCRVTFTSPPPPPPTATQAPPSTAVAHHTDPAQQQQQQQHTLPASGKPRHTRAQRKPLASALTHDLESGASLPTDHPTAATPSVQGNSAVPSGSESEPGPVLGRRLHVASQSELRKRDLGYIPVMGVPLVSDSPLYLLRWFYSIDLPVHHIVVVSGGSNAFVEAETAHIADQGQNITLITCDEFLAVTEGWNEILSAYADSAPWTLITAYDVQFMPGSLATLARRFWADADKGLDFAHISWTSAEVEKWGQWNAWAITRRLVVRAGLFDENIAPAFFEGTTSTSTASTASSPPPANSTTYDDVWALHGNKAKGQASYTSGTTKIAESLLQTRMARGREMNPDYLARKWGCKKPRRKGDGWKEVDYATCQYKVPFDVTGREVWEWEVDLSRRARLYGVFGYFGGLSSGDRRSGRVVLGRPFTASYKGLVAGGAGW